MHHQQLADEYLPEAIDRINKMNQWVRDKWPALLTIQIGARVNNGGEYHKATADLFRDAVSLAPEWLRVRVTPPGYLGIAVCIMNAESTCQYYNTSRYLGPDNVQETLPHTVVSVRAAFAEYEKEHLERVQAEARERAVYWSIHPFFQD